MGSHGKVRNLMKKTYVSEKLKLSEKSPLDIEALVLRSVKAVATENGTVGIDGVKADGTTVEVKVHGKNRCSLGRISMTKSVSQNIADLLVADIYYNVRPQGIASDPRPFVLTMTKSEMAEWLFERVVYDLNRHKQPKFKINFFERSKKQDRKLVEMGLELS